MTVTGYDIVQTTEEECLRCLLTVYSPRGPVLCNNKPMPRKAAADDANGCRFGWYPRILTLLVSAGLGLSLYSSLDCKFLVSSEFQCNEFMFFFIGHLTYEPIFLFYSF